MSLPTLPCQLQTAAFTGSFGSRLLGLPWPAARGRALAKSACVRDHSGALLDIGVVLALFRGLEQGRRDLSRLKMNATLDLACWAGALAAAQASPDSAEAARGEQEGLAMVTVWDTGAGVRRSEIPRRFLLA